MKLLADPPSTVQPGTFIVPSGAQLRSVTNDDALAGVWAEVGQCFGYPKPDGWRMQIHKLGHEVYLFSRSGKDWTAEFPTIVQMIRDRVKDDQMILDTELVGFDAYGSHLGPSKLCEAPYYRCYVLDTLYLRGQVLIDWPTKKRISFTHEYLQHALYGMLTLAEYKFIEAESALVDLYQSCMTRQKEGFDGVIIKQIDAPYFTNVFKLKPEETIDAVVVGAYLNKQGEIKTLLLAVPSHERKSWIPIAKVGKRSTDWDTVWAACEPHVCQHRPYRLEDPPIPPPHLWIDPQVVVAIAATSLGSGTGYQVHAFAARNCMLREDKSPKEATSFEQVSQIANLDERRRQP